MSESAAGAAIEAGRAVLTTLPPAFLLLCLINCGFLGMTYWFLNTQIEQRTAIVNKVVDGCMQRLGQHP